MKWLGYASAEETYSIHYIFFIVGQAANYDYRLIQMVQLYIQKIMTTITKVLEPVTGTMASNVIPAMETSHGSGSSVDDALLDHVAGKPPSHVNVYFAFLLYRLTQRSWQKEEGGRREEDIRWKEEKKRRTDKEEIKWS